MINKLLDASIYFSFDKSGFIRHQKSFTGQFQFKTNGNALITGGSSGIGHACALELAKSQVNVWTTGRDEIKGIKSCENHSCLKFHKLDMADWKGIPHLVNTLPRLDYIVLNAGGMPAQYSSNEQGVESQFASQLFGHYYLIKALKNAKKLNIGTRIIWVTSGGMYLANLSLKTITETQMDYDKVATYANVKRAQVTLLDFFKDEFPDQLISAMHPGWAETPGVKSAIPQFDKKMKGKLRTPLQGADTILWFLGTTENIESGKLYFDRKQVTPHLFWFTRKSDKLKTQLISLLKKFEPDID